MEAEEAAADADAAASELSSVGLDEQRGQDGGGHGVAADEWLQNVLCTLADTQRQLADTKHKAVASKISRKSS